MSTGARSVVKLYTILLKALGNRYNEHIRDRVSTFLEEWRKRFAIIYGKEPSEIRFLNIKIDRPDIFLYALHTYYTVLVKCLGACIVGIHLGYDIALELVRRGLDALREIEIEGKPFKQYGILNLIEPDIYSWYLVDRDKTSEEFEKEMSEVISGIGRVLGKYNFKFVKPTRDILKRLYQNIIPRDIRKGLGEFYTPDWLAQYMLDRVGFTGKIDPGELNEAIRRGDYTVVKSIRLLDPACGSGTFLFHAILRVLEANKKLVEEKPHIVAKVITENIVGFDISPLAVITSKITYLLALSPILEHIGEVRIPIYETDSILVPEGRYVNLVGQELRVPVPLPDSAKRDLEGKGRFPGIVIPMKVIEDPGKLEEFIRCLHELLQHTAEDYFNKSLSECSKIFPRHVLVHNIDIISTLREHGRDKIWLSVIKNWVMPLITAKKPFRYIVGNPPWINVSNMPEEYRDALDLIFEKYKLVPRGGSSTKLEFAMLFVYVSANRFLENGGVLGMLITKRVFEGGHGALFRRFTIPVDKGEVPLKVIECHDMLKIKPFHTDVQNEAGAIILRKGEETTKFKMVIWSGPSMSTTDTWEPTLDEVLHNTTTEEVELELRRIQRDNYVEYVFVKPAPLIDAVLRQGNPYIDVHEGATINPREVLLVKHTSVSFLPNNLCRLSEKYLIECDYVYPALKGESIDRWLIREVLLSILPYTDSGEFLDSNLVRTLLWRNLLSTNEFLAERTRARTLIGWESQDETLRRIIADIRGLVGKNVNILEQLQRKYRLDDLLKLFKIVRIKHNISSSIKVCWQDISDRFRAVVVSRSTIQRLIQRYGLPQELLKKNVVVDYTIDYVIVGSEDEAHYICAVLNSKPVNEVVRYMAPKHLQPRVFKSIYIPKYHPNNPIHILLSTCSYLAHYFAYKSHHEGAKALDSHLKKVEELIDTLVEALYNIRTVDINDIVNKLLSIVNEVKSGGITIADDIDKKVTELLNKAQRTLSKNRK